MKPKTAQWVSKAESDIKVARAIASGERPHPNETCFHCQQAAEKYLKALLQEIVRRPEVDHANARHSRSDEDKQP